LSLDSGGCTHESRSPLHSSVLVIAAMISLASAGPAQDARESSTLPREVHGRNSALLARRYDDIADLAAQRRLFVCALALKPLASDS
jgi:hypothetical protein